MENSRKNIRKKVLTSVMTALIAASPVTIVSPVGNPSIAHAADVSVEDTVFEYVETEEGNIVITGFKQGEKTQEVKIPTKIDGKDVVEIQSQSFQNKGITKVEIGDSDNTSPRIIVGSNAFAQNDIKEVSFGV